MSETFVEILSREFRKRYNPTDLRSAIIGKVTQINPIIIQIEDGKILLSENKD